MVLLGGGLVVGLNGFDLDERKLFGKRLDVLAEVRPLRLGGAECREVFSGEVLVVIDATDAGLRRKLDCQRIGFRVMADSGDLRGFARDHFNGRGLFGFGVHALPFM